jgi:hypothetical protein
MKGKIYRFNANAPLGLVMGKCQFGLLVQWLDIHVNGNHNETLIFLEGAKKAYQVNPNAIQFVPITEFIGKTPVDTIDSKILDSWMCDSTLQKSSQAICAQAGGR